MCETYFKSCWEFHIFRFFFNNPVLHKVTNVHFLVSLKQFYRFLEFDVGAFHINLWGLSNFSPFATYKA